MATPPPLEASGIEVATSGGATRTFTISIPSDLEDSVLGFSIDWFAGSTSTVTQVLVGGSATGVVQIGTQQPGREGDSDNEGMWLGYRAAPASGSLQIAITFSETQGSNEVGLVWVVLSGVDPEEIVDVFENPELQGDIDEYTFDLTPAFPNGFLFCPIHTNTDPTNGASADLLQIDPTDFTEGWYDPDTGAAGAQQWDWTTDTDRVTTGAVIFKAVQDGGGQVVAVGQASETDAGIAVGKLKSKAVAPAAETDAAIAVGRLKSKTVAPAAETDAGLPVGARKSKAVGIASETDAGLPVGKTKTKAVGQAAETDAGLPAGRLKSKAVGPGSETDAGLPAGAAKSKTVAPAAETDAAIAATAKKTKAVGIATETDVGLPLVGQTVFPVGQAAETDVALPAAARKSKAVGIAGETDAALPAGKAKRKAVGIAAEADQAIALQVEGLEPVIFLTGDVVDELALAGSVPSIDLAGTAPALIGLEGDLE